MCWIIQGCYQYSFRPRHSCWRKSQVFLIQQSEQYREGSMFIIPYRSSLAALPIAGRDLDLPIWKEKTWKFPPAPSLKVCRAIDLKTSWATSYTQILWIIDIINEYYEGCFVSSFPTASIPTFENVSFNLHKEILHFQLICTEALYAEFEWCQVTYFVDIHESMSYEWGKKIYSLHCNR